MEWFIAEVEWDLRILKLTKRVLEAGKNAGIGKILKGLNKLSGTRNSIMVSRREIKKAWMLPPPHSSYLI